MRTVVRIEHEKNGLGMFRSNANYRMGDEFNMRHSRFPTPYNDTLVGIGKLSTHNGYLDIRKDCKAWFCAFKSIEQMNEWVTPEEIKQLLNMGFKVFSITTEVYQEGEYQVIFSKEDIFTKNDITDLFL